MAMKINRREMIIGAGAMAASLLTRVLSSTAHAAGQQTQGAQSYVHKLPPLPYPYDALEPIIDEQTMRIHHGKHFAAYVNGLNAAVEKMDKARKEGDMQAVRSLSDDLAFNGSGVVLHWIYFSTIGPKAGGTPGGKLGEMIKRDFGSFEAFWKQFAQASVTVHGSGWGILNWEPFSKRLVILQAEKHQNQTSWGAMPLLACDVWEHAYYLKYQNRRAEYVENFAKIIDWKKVEERLEAYCTIK